MGYSCRYLKRLTAIAERHKPTSTSEWQLLSPRHAPEDSLFGHLELAIKWEGIDLGVLAALFKVIDDREVAKIIRSEPTGSRSEEHTSELQSQ